MPLTVAVQVPTSDRADLQVLIDDMGASDDLVAAHPFDGEAFVQTVVILSSVGFPYFRTWLRSRADAGKHCSVAFKGMKLRGYTHEEVNDIIQKLTDRFPDDT